MKFIDSIDIFKTLSNRISFHYVLDSIVSKNDFEIKC